MSSTPSLRDYLLDSLSSLPNPSDLQLTALSSKPKRTNAIFPHARHPPKCLEKQYIVTLGITLPASPGSVSGNNGEPSSVTAEASSTSNAGSGPGSGSTPGSGSKVLVVAIHAYLYTLPSLPVPRSILYISKVDSSGYSPTRLPLTRALVTPFIGHHLRYNEVIPGGGTVQVRLFARSQGQYLFPNSVKAPGKRVTGGLGLCSWWKGVYEDVARMYAESLAQSRADTSKTTSNGSVGSGSTPNSSGDTSLKMRYLLPSYSAEEAAGMLGAPKRSIPAHLKLSWVYGPPFASVPSSTPHNKESGNLGLMIPSLPDDPKTRFMDELISEAGLEPIKSRSSASGTTKPSGEIVAGGSDPAEGKLTNSATHGKDNNHAQLGPTSSAATLVGSSSKRTTTTGPSSRRPHDALREREKEREDADRQASETALSRISPEEFWERMGFRQECASGDVTGFFSLETVQSSSSTTKSVTSMESKPLEPTSSTATLANGDAGPHTDGETQGGSARSNDTIFASASTASSMVASGNAPSSGATDISNNLVDRLLTALTNCDFATLLLALESSKSWMESARGIVVGEIGEGGWKDCTGMVPAKQGLEMAGQVGAEKRKEEVVTTLQPRKKKRT